MKKRLWVRMLSALFVAIATMRAQEFKGTLLGRITDPSGAVIPNANITVRNEETGVPEHTISNAGGNYTFPFLLPGRYTVRTEAKGFRTTEQHAVNVDINDRIELNVMLQVGSSSEKIVVEAGVSQLQTASSDLGQVAERPLIEGTLLTSSVLQLANLAPGVLAGGTLGVGNTISNSQNSIAVNGGNGTQNGNDVTIDGSPALAPRQSGLAVGIPMPDAVQEFKIVTTMFDASLGRSNGGAVSLATRSGTNDYHGAGYYYTQNNALNANTWANNRNGIAKPDVDVYAGGGVVGGPVRLPKYDGRNRTFFFVGYEQDHNGQHELGLARVPTGAERQGGFSQTLSSSGKALTLYNPFSTVTTASGSFVSRTPFPGAKIPTDLLNPTGVAVLSKLPEANLNVVPQINTPNWTQDMKFIQPTKNFQSRFDQSIGDKQRLFFRYAELRYLAAPAPAFFPGADSVPPSGTSNLNTDDRH
jgi:hypothetical protein